MRSARHFGKIATGGSFGSYRWGLVSLIIRGLTSDTLEFPELRSRIRRCTLRTRESIPHRWALEKFAGLSPWSIEKGHPQDYFCHL